MPGAAGPEERRLVTTLFCDLVGFTPLAERLDPEEVRELQAEYFTAMRRQIERYGGTIQKYAGDAVLALFGVPVAHEDDAERAVLCGIGMQEAIASVAETAVRRHGVPLQIRVGVNTGEVVSGSWDSSGEGHLDVSGDAVNTAARLQAAAEPGEVLVAAETMLLTRRRIGYGESREVHLKGKERSVSVYPARTVREEIGERWEAHRTPLVGRERELAELPDAWRRAQQGEGQLVTVIGDPGIGKSRLVGELLNAIRGYGLKGSATLLASMAEASAAVRDDEAAKETVNEGVARATAEDDRIDLIYALRASARLALRQRRWDDARNTLEQALALVRRVDFPYCTAELLAVSGELHRARGAIKEAREMFQQALDIFKRLGARRDVEQTERELRQFDAEPAEPIH